MSRLKRRLIGIALEADSALRLPIPIGLVTELDSLFAVRPGKGRSIGLVTETDVPPAFTHFKRVVLGLVQEADLAQALTRLKQRGLGLVVEVDQANGFVFVRVVPLGLVTETDVPNKIDPIVFRYSLTRRERSLGQTRITPGVWR